MTRKINIARLMLLAICFLLPYLGSAFNKVCVIYVALALTGVVLGIRWYKNGSLKVGKTTVFLFAVSIFAAFSMTYVSDKYSQFTLFSLLLLCTFLSLLINDYKEEIGVERLFGEAVPVIKGASIFYAVMVILHQIFIETSFWGSNMALGQGSATATCCMMIMGFSCTVYTFMNSKKKNKVAFIASLMLFVYVFVMTKSFMGYFCASFVVFMMLYSKGDKKQRIEAFCAFVAMGAFGVIQVIITIADIFKNGEYVQGAIKGLVNVLGIGCEGYNAASNVLGKGYEGYSSLINLLSESFGVVGLGIAVLWIWRAVSEYRKNRKEANLIMLAVSFAIIFSSSAAAVYTLPLAAMYYSARENTLKVNFNKVLGVVMVVPASIFAYMSFAYIPYASARDAWDVGDFEKSARCYEQGARMEKFNSSMWIKAYEAENEAFKEGRNGEMREIYVENAIRYNSKNYSYKVYKARLLTQKGEYENALLVWDEIITRHDKEVLYPEYAEKIADVMANCDINLEKMESLYKKIDILAKKAQDKTVILKVNNTLAKSQQYYINLREGEDIPGDMYITEEISEVEYESSNPAG